MDGEDKNRVVKDYCILWLLNEWIEGKETPNVVVVIAKNQNGHRGLHVLHPVFRETTLLCIPWKQILGINAAVKLINFECSKGRGISDGDDDEVENDAEPRWLQRLFRACESLNPIKVWSCIMAIGILSSLRYPLSAWSPYICTLPSSDTDKRNNGRVDAALRRCHALTIRHMIKRCAKRSLPRGEKISPSDLKLAKEARDEILSTSRECMDHPLFWTTEELQATNDEELLREVNNDKRWLRQVWTRMFCTNLEQSKSPIVSWDSFVWAHGIVRSRSIGLDHNNIGFIQSVTSYKSIEGAGVFIPMVDLINHASSAEANARLELRAEGVAVVATREIHNEILFDYHPNATLRHFLRSYGFVDKSVHIRQTFRVASFDLDFSLVSVDGFINVKSFQYAGNGRTTIWLSDSNDEAVTLDYQQVLFLTELVFRLTDSNGAVCPWNGDPDCSLPTDYARKNHWILSRAHTDLRSVVTILRG